MLVAARGFLPRFPEPGVGLENSRGHGVLPRGIFRAGGGDLGKSPIKMSNFSQSEGV